MIPRPCNIEDPRNINMLNQQNFYQRLSGSNIQQPSPNMALMLPPRPNLQQQAPPSCCIMDRIENKMGLDHQLPQITVDPMQLRIVLCFQSLVAASMCLVFLAVPFSLVIIGTLYLHDCPAICMLCPSMIGAGSCLMFTLAFSWAMDWRSIKSPEYCPFFTGLSAVGYAIFATMQTFLVATYGEPLHDSTQFGPTYCHSVPYFYAVVTSIFFVIFVPTLGIVWIYVYQTYWAPLFKRGKNLTAQPPCRFIEP